MTQNIFSSAQIQNLFAEYESGKTVTVGEMTFQKATTEQPAPQAQTPAPATIPHLTSEALAAASARLTAETVAKAEAAAQAEAEAARVAEVRATARAFNAARRGKR